MTIFTDVKIKVNNVEEILNKDCSLEELLENKQTKRRCLVWLNNKKMKESDYKLNILRDGDSIKIIRIVAGG